ncbi:hypothetical protein Ade02nite_79160 [Paractinoplanes deccanensis]|uniref:DUF4760 domain-containing protein n=1 Tax=Paractinoplanes deccanensis TaxID=113561 RepID=A0ABQ3YHL4_9ACTN|nr:DUF6082 family protein [Actinoplanes deccanensis]GID79275.1 hypothetical protein Ade02nite_79160 [Actinoplanes deccanensis]
MTTADSRTAEHTGTFVRWVLVTMCVAGFAAAMVSVILAPLLLIRLSAPGDDYSRASDIGQAYGAASAVIATLTLAVVMAGLAVQHRQLRNERVRSMLGSTEELVKIAMDEPVYRQCWGARVAPEGLDEDLFYYCNRILKAWKQGWDLREMSETQTRRFLANFFDSEVPRRFWELHGDWHETVKARSRREQFLAIVNEEYLRATKGGPPSRARETREPPARTSSKSRRQNTVEHDYLNGRRVVP